MELIYAYVRSNMNQHGINSDYVFYYDDKDHENKVRKYLGLPLIEEEEEDQKQQEEQYRIAKDLMIEYKKIKEMQNERNEASIKIRASAARMEMWAFRCLAVVMITGLVSSAFDTNFPFIVIPLVPNLIFSYLALKKFRKAADHRKGY